VAAKLNRDVIAGAGLRLLDKSGIEGVTLRALAAELGVQAPTLYWHVKSKREIFQAMAVAISQDAAARTAAMDPRAPWQERLRSWAHALRHSILDHRDGGRVFAGTFAADPATFHVTEAALQAWREAGLPLAEAAQRTVLLRHFIVGFCIEEQALAKLNAERDQAALRELKATADPARCPLTSEALPEILSTSAEARFELGLQLMLGVQRN
jgi:TetR/AcrR family transcriptional regulator, tetracycline repressor protein